MKKMASLLYLGIALSLVGQSAIAAVVGTVDIQRILLSVEEGKKIRKKLEKSFNAKKKVLKKDEDKIKKAQDAFIKKKSLLSATAQDKKRKEIQEQIMKLQSKTAEFQRDIQEAEAKLKKPVLEKLKEIIDAVSAKNKVDFTFEASASPLVYAKNAKDLTEEVIKSYDKKYPVKKKK